MTKPKIKKIMAENTSFTIDFENRDWYLIYMDGHKVWDDWADRFSTENVEKGNHILHIYRREDFMLSYPIRVDIKV